VQRNDSAIELASRFCEDHRLALEVEMQLHEEIRTNMNKHFGSPKYEKEN